MCNKNLKVLYERTLKELEYLSPTDDDYQQTMERAVKLQKMVQDEAQATTDCVTKWIACGSALVVGMGGLILRCIYTDKAFRFEENGSISSLPGRSIIGDWFRFRDK